MKSNRKINVGLELFNLIRFFLFRITSPLLMMIILLVASPGWSWTQWNGYLWPSKQCTIDISGCTGTIAGVSYKNIALTSMNNWFAYCDPDADFHFYYIDPTTACQYGVNDYSNCTGWTDLGQCTGGTITLGQTIIMTYGNDIVESDVALNSQCNWDAFGQTETISVISHEYGHVVGLTHSSVSPSLMSEYYQAGIWHPESDDCTGFYQIYSTAPACTTLTISPTSQTISSSGGTNYINVTTNTGCCWTASSNVSWITFPSGSSGCSNGTVNYSVVANSGSQRSGTITITGGSYTQTCTITQDAAQLAGTLQFSSSTYSVNENGGSVIITVTRAGGSSGAVGVNYATSNGTATAGSDYTSKSGTLSWSDGDTSNKTFSITILDDSTYEGNETVNLSLSSATGGATLGSPSSAVLTILDNESAPPPPPGNWTLTVASSNPNSGVSITVSPNDNNDQGSGTTQFTRTYNNGTAVTLTAPSTAGGNNFQKWQRNGIDHASTTQTTVTMDANYTMTAIYVASCPTPSTPSSPSPSNGAIGVSTSSTLSWAACANTDSYDVYFGTFSNPPYVGNTTSTSYPRSGLSSNTLYYWKIVAKNNCGNSTSGSVWSFTTGSTQPMADFVVTSITITPTSPRANSRFTARVTVKNQGTVSGNAGFLDVWVDQPLSQSCGAEGNKWKSIGTLSAGKSKTFIFSGLSAGAKGTKTFRAFVDSECSTNESDENNNQTVTSYTVK